MIRDLSIFQHRLTLGSFEKYDSIDIEELKLSIDKFRSKKQTALSLKSFI